jgi:hypothetical protein
MAAASKQRARSRSGVRAKPLVIVTGAAGKVGSAIVAALQDGHRLVG